MEKEGKTHRLLFLKDLIFYSYKHANAHLSSRVLKPGFLTMYGSND